MKTYLLALALIISSSFLFSACTLFPSKNQSGNSTPTPISNLNVPTSITTMTPTSPLSKNATYTAINTKYGQIVIKLYTDKAPNTVKNFVSKADSGFYNNLTFHRVEPGFVVQGGDPLGNGTGGGDIASEINTVPFVRGSVGLARGGDIKISNDSQFFICLTTEQCSFLTGKYVNFGEVVSGMEAVDQIKIGDKIVSASSKTK